MPNLPFPKKAPPAPGWQRGTKKPFYDTRRWKDLRALHLSEQPVCAVCLELNQQPKGRMEVDHIVRIELGGAELNQRNLWTLCHYHHARKTAMERHGLELESEEEQGEKLPTKAAIAELKNRLK